MQRVYVARIFLFINMALVNSSQIILQILSLQNYTVPTTCAGTEWISQFLCILESYTWKGSWKSSKPAATLLCSSPLSDFPQRCPVALRPPVWGSFLCLNWLYSLHLWTALWEKPSWNWATQNAPAPWEPTGLWRPLRGVASHFCILLSIIFSPGWSTFLSSPGEPAELFLTQAVRQRNKSRGSEVVRVDFKSQFCLLLAVWTWVSHLTSLSLTLVTWGWGNIQPTPRVGS